MVEQVPFSVPFVAESEAEYLSLVLANRNRSGDGPFGRKVEKYLSDLLESPVLLTSSCTSALEIAALLLDIQPGDEVVVPSFTFVSSANAFAVHGATIVYTDINPITLCTDLTSVAAALTNKTRAVVNVNYAGNPGDIAHLRALCDERSITLIEDAAHSPFATCGEKLQGTFGHLGTFSFHATKNFSCGEGGALVVNDRALLDRARVIREKGTNRFAFFEGQVDKYTWMDVGSSYLMSEFQAAPLLAQLEAREEIQALRRHAWNQYRNALLATIDAHSGAQLIHRLPSRPEEASENPAHIFWLVLSNLVDRDSFVRGLNNVGIGATFHYNCLHQSPYGSRWGRGVSLPNAELVSRQLVRLPLFPSLSDSQLERVVAMTIHLLSELWSHSPHQSPAG